MGSSPFVDLAECTEFRQTLQERPPKLVHGTACLLLALLAAALAWSTLTQADLVVRAPGRVRPVTTPVRVISGVSGETLSGTSGGRVVGVYFHEGDEVSQGQVLVELDTRHLDSEMARRRRAIQAGEEELAKLDHLETLQARQFETARARAEAELAQAQEKIRQAKQRRVRDVRLVELELEGAKDEEGRLNRLARGAASPSELVKATLKVQEAQEQLAKARLPIDEGEVAVARQALESVPRGHAVKSNELQTKRGTRRGEVDGARIELATLELDRREANIRAPIAGVVTAGDVKVGDILERGRPVLEVAEQKAFLFEVAVPSEAVGELCLGMPVRIKLDAFDYQKYGTVDGVVCFIAPDSGVPEGQHAVMHLVRIEVRGEEVGRGELCGRVKLGMAGQAEIVTGRESLLTILVKKIRKTVSLG